MSKEFQEKLLQYKEGKLNPIERAEIKKEIDKFTAIMDYLSDDDREFWEELKQYMPSDHKEVNQPAKLFKHKVNLRILMLTGISVLTAIIVMILLSFLISNIAQSLFGLNYKEAYVKRAAIVQLAEIFHPQYESHGSGVGNSLFAQQNIRVSLDNTVGNTPIDETELNVRYSFGKPVHSGTTTKAPPLLSMEDFALLSGHESDALSGFKILEKAPQGTIAKVFIEFNKALTPEQLKENLINQLSTADITPSKITPLAAAGSNFVLANPSFYGFTPVYPYDNNTNQLKDVDLKQKQYENMDDQAHRESFIGNLNLIKNNKKLLQVMYYEEILQNINLDELIKHVENSGVEYVGAYISADSKELLKLKNNPLIHCLRVENIVIW